MDNIETVRSGQMQTLSRVRVESEEAELWPNIKANAPQVANAWVDMKKAIWLQLEDPLSVTCIINGQNWRR